MSDLSRLPRAELEAMARAGEEVAEIERVLAKTGDNVVSEALRGAGTFYEWHHYPPGDVYDHETHAQFFYHAHPPGQRRGDEHGHFHCFLRPRGMPPDVVPLVLPELAVADTPAAPADPLFAPVAQPNQGGNNDKLSHLVAISMDGNGRPIRLFTVNRWVTGETWYRAEDVVRMLDRFVIDLARPSWALNRWITAMYRLFRPQMAELLLARDTAIMNWRRRHRGKVHVFEDRRLDVASAVDIDIADQLRRIDAALRRAA
ncbi:MAG: hypothetical protein IRZ04_01980 [Rhodospirillales bacterium]|nr:hypothetical protein [Rhodospirillales bacterium]